MMGELLGELSGEFLGEFSPHKKNGLMNSKILKDPGHIVPSTYTGDVISYEPNSTNGGAPFS